MLRTKRIFRDFQEVMANPIEGVHVGIPDDNDISYWHLNLVFPMDHEYYPGLVMHAIMHFPVNFPDDPPSMSLCSLMIHSHVFQNTQICFSLLNEFREYFTSTHTHHTAFWNAMHTTREILSGVYDMLTHDVDKHVIVGRVERHMVMNAAAMFQCAVCGHNEDGVPWPLVDVDQQQKSQEALKKLDDEDQQKVKVNVFNPWDYSQDVIDHFTCPFTKENITSSENVVLGFGITIDQHKITSDYSMLSYSAFSRDGIRTSSAGFKFMYFVPFVINELHWRRSKGIFQEVCDKIVSNQDANGRRIGLIFLMFMHLFATVQYFSEKHIMMLHEFIAMVRMELQTSKTVSRHIAKYFDTEIKNINKPEILVFLSLFHESLDDRNMVFEKVLSTISTNIINRILIRNPLLLLSLTSSGLMQPAIPPIDVDTRVMEAIMKEPYRSDLMPTIMMIFFIRNMTKMSHNTMRSKLNELVHVTTVDEIHPFVPINVEVMIDSLNLREANTVVKTNDPNISLVKRSPV